MTGLNGDRGEVRVVLAAGAALLLLPVLLAAATGLVSQQASACSAQPSPSGQATTIPARYLALYRQAGRAYGIPWNVLAAIGEVESDHGRSGAPGVHSGANSAGAAGPMQFGIGGAAGNTWGGPPIHPASMHAGGYGIDGDHDGITDVYDPGDAIPSAASYLQANGAASNLIRTELGDSAAEATSRAIATIKARWRHEIGPGWYDTTKQALRQLGHASLKP